MNAKANELLNYRIMRRPVCCSVSSGYDQVTPPGLANSDYSYYFSAAWITLAIFNMNQYLFLCLLPFAACQKESEETPKDKPLVPLAIGNKWIYDNKAYNSDGSYCCSEENTTWEIMGKSNREGFFLLDEFGSDQMFSSAEKVIHYYPDEEEAGLEFRRSIKIDTFDVINYPDGYKLVSVAFPDSYLIDTHNCLMNEYLTYDDQGNLYSKDVHYVEPGLGYIRMEYYYADENGDLKLDMREDLLSHELKN